MPEDKSASKHRDVACALVFCPATHRILMITSRKHPKLWILPKGGVEAGETSGEAAAREANEEAGVPTKLAPDAISSVLVSVAPAHAKAKKPEVWHAHAVCVAAETDLLDKWDEAEQRERAWYTPREALSRMEEWAPVLAVENGDNEGGGDEEADKKDDEEEQMKRGGKKKKAIKRDSMEQCLYAFVDRYGWEKK